MRKLMVSAIAVCIVLLSVPSSAQVFTTAQKMREGTFRLAIAPILLVDNGVSPGMYLLGGTSITRSIDLYCNARFADNDRSYFGVDLQWALVRAHPALSLTTGVHLSDHIGLDGTFNITFPLQGSTALYGGLTMNIDFVNGDFSVPAWIFFGPKISITRRMALFMEVDLAVTTVAPSIFGLGLSFYLPAMN